MTTLKQLTDVIAQRTSVSKTQIDRVFEVMVEEMSQALMRGEEIRWPAIGTLTVKTAAAMTGRNPRTGETLDIAERQRVRFKVSKLLNDRLNPPRPAMRRRRSA